MSDIVERLREPLTANEQRVMMHWDKIRSLLLHEQNRGSLPRDFFESLLSDLDEERSEAAAEITSLRKQLEEARLFEKALRIAHGAHDGQTDKTGAPYILHPIRVSLMGECADDRIVGLLHDVVEDCQEWPMKRLSDHFPPHIMDAVDALTRRDGEDYMAFIDRVKLNAIATRVKLNDMADNIDPHRLARLPAHIGNRLQRKYSAAIRKLAGDQP